MANEGNNNFKTALKELLGEKEEKREATSSETEGRSVILEQRSYASIPTVAVRETVITEDTTIEGSVTTKGSIRVNGRINGDVTGDSEIYVTGNVGGNLRGKSISISGGNVVGDIKAEVNVRVESGSAIVGNIDSKELSCNGNCKGNLMVAGGVVLESRANIQGSITGGRLLVAEGAAISGFVKIIPSESAAEPPVSAPIGEEN